MWVIWVDVGAAVAGLAALSGVGFRLYRQIKQVRTTLADATSTLNDLTSELDRLKGPAQRRTSR